jgi:ABC-type multidrug transport system fused ATPase/permease subunit
MSGHGIHVHGAHDHAVEHEAHKGGLGQQVAIFSAVLATVGAIVSFFGGSTQNDALLFKNEAVFERAEASDQWNYYQAKSMKQNLAELAATVATDPKKVEFHQAEAKRYAAEKKEIEQAAKKHDAKATEWNEKSAHALHPHHYLSISMTLLQIAIALASITVLTQKRWLLFGAAGSAFVGAVLAVIAYLS